MNLFKSEFFGIQIIINYLSSLKTTSTYSSLSASKPFNFQKDTLCLSPVNHIRDSLYKGTGNTVLILLIMRIIL